MNRRLAWIPDLLVQFVLLVAGVLLALAVDQWREARSNARLADVALLGVRDELTHNRAIFAVRVPYHIALNDSIGVDLARHLERHDGIRVWKPGDHLTPPQAMGFEQGFMLSPALSRNAWQTAMAANLLSFLDYRTMAMLSAAYAKQTELDATTNRLTEQFPLILGGYAGADQYKAAIVEQTYMRDLILREHETLAEYDTALADLNQRRIANR